MAPCLAVVSALRTPCPMLYIDSATYLTLLQRTLYFATGEGLLRTQPGCSLRRGERADGAVRRTSTVHWAAVPPLSR